MEDLKLPVIKKATPAAKDLSMDKYMKFVFLNLKYTSHKKEHRRAKKMFAVTTPFSI